MVPVFRISADGTEITQLIRDRLLSLTITDDAGEDSDTLDIVLDDRDGVIELPRKGVELDVWLGYGDGLSMGMFVVDELELSFPPATLRITARAANFSNSDTAKNRRVTLREQKTRDWHETTLGKVLETIAGEHGFEPRITSELAAVPLAHIDQIDESDLNLLTRLARENDAIAKPAAGRLLFLPRTQVRNADGRQPDPVTLTPGDLTSWRIVMPDRSRYGSVIAHYHDVESASLTEVKAGEGEPVFRIKRSFPDEASATRAAQAKLGTFQRGAIELNAELPGNPLLAAGTPVILAGFRGGVDRTYTANRAEHVLSDGGYACRVTAEGNDAGDE